MRNDYSMVTPFMGDFGISQAEEGVCSTKSWGGKAHCRWHRERLNLLLVRIKFFFSAWVELFPPTKGGVRSQYPRVGVGVSRHFSAHVSESHRSLKFSIEAATYRADRLL